MENTEFGKILRKMREDSGKTIQEVSAYLTLRGHKAATQTIYGWERGVSQPNPDPFLEMCKFYGVTNVFSYFGDVPEISDVISFSERDHIKKYRTLDLYGKEAVDGVLDVEYKRCSEERKDGSAKTPALVSVDGLDDMENLLMICSENMDPVQRKMFLEQWRKLSKQQKESSMASDPLEVDGKFPESEIHDLP